VFEFCLHAKITFFAKVSLSAKSAKNSFIFNFFGTPKNYIASNLFIQVAEYNSILKVVLLFIFVAWRLLKIEHVTNSVVCKLTKNKSMAKSLLFCCAKTRMQNLLKWNFIVRHLRRIVCIRNSSYSIQKCLKNK
jgi:hypothetical protein